MILTLAGRRKVAANSKDRDGEISIDLDQSRRLLRMSDTTLIVLQGAACSPKLTKWSAARLELFFKRLSVAQQTSEKENHVIAKPQIRGNSSRTLVRRQTRKPASFLPKALRQTRFAISVFRRASTQVRPESLTTAKGFQRSCRQTTSQTRPWGFSSDMAAVTMSGFFIHHDMKKEAVSLCPLFRCGEDRCVHALLDPDRYQNACSIQEWFDLPRRAKLDYERVESQKATGYI